MAPRILEEVKDILSGKTREAAQDIAEATGEKLIGAPNAQTMRDVRDALKQALYIGGNPKQGLKDGISKTEASILESMYAQVQTLFKAIPEAKQADMLYSRAANYSKQANKAFFKPDGNGGRAISNAAMESFVLGKGSAGRVEDLDRIFVARGQFADEMAKLGKTVGGEPAAAIEQARMTMSFNRLGQGDSTGRSLAPLITALAQPTLAPFAMAAYNPRMFFRVLREADNLTKEDKKVLSTLVLALSREKDKKAIQMFSGSGEEEKK